MFCPVCEAEYREGFTRCADCDVDLVAALDNARPRQEAAVVLWRGLNPVLFSALQHALGEAGIAFHERTRHDHYERIFGEHWEIYVRRSDLEAARGVLAAVTADVEQAAELPLGLEPPLEPEEVAAPVVPADWDEEEATAEIWAGHDPTFAEVLRRCLREAGVPARFVVDDSGPDRLLVRPEDERLARQIVRQVSEGTPPV